MADYGDIVTRIALDSDVVRVYPNALIQIYTSGTATLIWEGNADASGNWSVPTLASGKYDIKVNGTLVRTIHHVTSDHTHDADETWTFFKAGTISADADESANMQIFGSDVAGSIIKVMIVAQSIDVTADLTVHLLKGAKGGGSALTMAGNSAWNYRIYPASAQNRFMYIDNNPGIAVAADECLTLAYDWAAATISGLTVMVIFRPD